MDVLDLGRYFGALLLVGALLGLAWLVARKYGSTGFSGLGNLTNLIPAKTQRRLSVVETMMMGPRHKLYLLRRDGIEHLIVVGPDGTRVVENGIAAPIVPGIEVAPVSVQATAA